MNTFKISGIPQNGHIHFIGIGGISMSGLAEIMHRQGFRVSGSDLNETHITRRLSEMGITVHTGGHAAAYVEGADLVVYTAAVKEDNVELVAAVALGIKAIERATLMGALMQGYQCSICIAGTHGKTTTTSMMSHVLMAANLDPTITLGGELDLIGGSIRAGGKDYFLAESCEYHNSFLQFFPNVAVITNVDADHLDFFEDIDDIKRAFSKFANLPGANGFVVVCGEDDNAMECVHDTNARVITYGISPSNEIHPLNLSYHAGYGRYDIDCNGRRSHVVLNVPGAHNVLNSLACIAAGAAMQLDADAVVKGIGGFTGVHRRFEKKGEINGAVIIDDYAHHPTEIKCTLASAAAMAQAGVRVIFQPHTYSRTLALLDDFADALSIADEIIVTDIYAAREPDNGLIHARDLAEKLAGKGKRVSYISSFEDIAGRIEKTAAPGEIIITMGAGTVNHIANMLVTQSVTA